MVTSATFTENILSFAVAYGLALQGLKLTRLQTNLLPSEIRARAAGARQEAVGRRRGRAAHARPRRASASATTSAIRPFGAPVVAEAETKATEVAGQADADETKFDETKDAALKEEEAVKSIVAGQSERKDWLELTRFLFGEAVPQPDGANLSEHGQAVYWDNKNGKGMSGKEAWEDFLKHPEGQSDRPRRTRPRRPQCRRRRRHRCRRQAAGRRGRCPPASTTSCSSTLSSSTSVTATT